jgi:hypothetical protein
MKLIFALVAAVALLAQPNSALAADGCQLDMFCDSTDGVSAGADAFVGRGGLILPASFVGDRINRSDAALCDGCEWRIQPVCSQGEAQGDICAGAAIGCPPDELRMRVIYRASPTDVWVSTGLVCVGDTSRPVRVADVAERVRDRFVDRLPRPEPRFQPAGGGLTNLPVIFRSGQSEGTRSDDFALLGMPVQVGATPRWTWRWGDGSSVLRTTDAGSRWPDTEVSHRFTRAGRYAVTVEAAWSGTFTVDGLGPFEVDGGPVAQQAELDVVVRDAPAELVGD